MSKRIEFLVGRAKSGKSTYILDKIVAHEQAHEPVLLIVPGRYTFETEKMITDRLNGGSFYTTICSLSRLSEKVLSEAGIRQVFMSEQGRLMVIRKALMGLELGVFGNSAQKPGFAKTCDDVLQGFINNLTEPEDVEAVSNEITNPLLQRKVSDFAKIFSATTDILKEKGLNPSDNHDAFLNNIPNSTLCKSHIYIDGFESTGELTFTAIEAIIQTCASLTISFMLDLTENIRDSRLFTPDMAAYLRLKDFTKELGYDLAVISPTRQNRYKSLELAHFEKEIFAFPYIQFAGEVESIRLLAANNIDSEVHTVAGAIQKMVRDEGVRYNEIAVIAADEAAYSVKVRNEFGKNAIPVFCDVEYSLYSMDVSNLTMSALRAVSGGYDKHELISIMKTGLCGVTRWECEVFEKYLIEYGVYGSSLKEPLKKGNPTFLEILDPIRIKLIEPLVKLQSALAKGNVATKTKAVYQYLEDLEVQKQLKRNVENLEKQDNLEQAERCAQVWNALIGIFDQLYTVMGDLTISNSHFISIIEEGLRAHAVSSIPSSIDNVLFGSMKRTIPRGIKRLFVLGAYEGAFPKVIKDDSVIDDAELNTLAQHGLKVWGTTSSLTDAERLELYTLLTLPTEKLYISFPAIVANATKLPSQIFEKTKKIFPNLKVITNNDESLESYKLLNIERLASDLRLFADTGEISETAKRLYAYLYSFPENAYHIDLIAKSLFFRASPDNLDPNFATELYGEEISASATRLETFNKCPFFHFAKYGLNVDEVREYKVENVDVGSFAHEILDRFVAHLIDNSLPYKDMSKQECMAIINFMLPELIANFKDGYFTESARRKANCDLLVNMTKKTAWAIIEHMKSGKFEFFKSELEFGEGKDYPPLEIELADSRVFKISGKVDRVDSYKGENEAQRIRIIDYKLSKNTSFDYLDLYEGLKLQLPLYSKAVAAGVQATTAGMYLMPISASVKDPKKDIEEQLKKAYRLTGLTLNDVSIIEATDKNLDNDNKDSFVINAKLTKDGYHSNSQLYAESQMQAVQQYAMEKAEKTANSIIDGDIEVSPFKKGDTTSCEYCPYGAICMFDKRLPDYKHRKLKSMGADAFFEKVAEKAKGKNTECE